MSHILPDKLEIQTRGPANSPKLILILFLFMRMGVLPPYTSATPHMHAVLLEVRRGLQFQLVVSHQVGFEDQTLFPLEEQPGLLTAEPSLQSRVLFKTTVMVTFI